MQPGAGEEEVKAGNQAETSVAVPAPSAWHRRWAVLDTQGTAARGLQRRKRSLTAQDLRFASGRTRASFLAG